MTEISQGGPLWLDPASPRVTASKQDPDSKQSAQTEEGHPQNDQQGRQCVPRILSSPGEFEAPM